MSIVHGKLLKEKGKQYGVKYQENKLGTLFHADTPLCRLQLFSYYICIRYLTLILHLHSRMQQNQSIF